MTMTKSMWSPLLEPVFRALWIAAVVSNVGSWMHDVAAAWLMTSLAPQPFMVAIMQTAQYLPFFLLSLPAGAMADVFDRRKLLIIGQLWMLIAAMSLSALTYLNWIEPWSLLILTFMLSIGGAASSPSWNAITPELVPREKLEAAVALGGVGWNIARGVGAAIGGIVVAAGGPAAVFLLNSISFVGVIYVLVSWKHKPQETSSAPTEKMIGAIKAGVRYVRHSPPMMSVLVRTFTFAISASAIWALLPLLARQKLGLNSLEYGLMLSLFGLGSLLGAAILPKLRHSISLDQVAAGGVALFAVMNIGVAYAQNGITGSLFMILGGIAWIIVSACLNVGAQMSSPQWVRARALAVYILVFQGSLAAGSALWGAVAQYTNLVLPLLISAGTMLLALLLTKRYPLGMAENLDTTLSMHWTDPELAFEPHPEHGPVLITVEYRIDPAQAKEFTGAMKALSIQRRRDGAFQWHLFCDVADTSRYVETFFVESWAEHMRQHERVLVGDKVVEDKANSFHIGEMPPLSHHLINAFVDDSTLLIPVMAADVDTDACN